MTTTAPTYTVEIDFTTDLAATNSYAEQVLGTGPLIFHRLQETAGTSAADASGNSYTGTLVGTFTLNQTTSKPVSGESASRYILLGGGGGGGSPGRVNFTAPQASRDRITFMTWVRQDSLDGSAGTSYIIGENDGSAGSATLYEWKVQGDGKVKMTFGSLVITTSAAQVSASTFTHLAVSLDGPNQTGTVYVNGASVASTISGLTAGILVPPPPSLTTWRWGTDQNTASISPIDRIAEPAVWVRELDATEVSAIYGSTATAPFAGYTWTDITTYVTDTALERRFGRESSLEDVTPMELSFELNNRDRRFEPGYLGTNAFTNPSFETNTTGWNNHAGGVLTRVTSQFFVGVASGQVVCTSTGDGVEGDVSGLTVGGLYTYRVRVRATAGEQVLWGWDSPIGTFLGTAGTHVGTGSWTEITGTFTAGAGGTARLHLQSSTGAQTFHVDLAELGIPTYKYVTPGRPCRVRMTQDAVTYDWAFGFIEDFPQVWPQNSLAGRVPIVARCFLARMNQTAAGSQNFVQQLAGTRVGTILNAADFPPNDRTLDAGVNQMMALTVESGTFGDHVRQVARSDRGLFHFDGAGYAIFQAGDYRTSNARSLASQATLGMGSGEIAYAQPEFHAPAALIRNDIRLRRPGGVDQIAVDRNSQRRYGIRSYSDELLLTTDAVMATRSADLLADYKDPSLRVRAVTFNPAQGSGFYAHALGVKLSDRYTWAFAPPVGALIASDVFVEGVHDIYADNEYLSTWFLSKV